MKYQGVDYDDLKLVRVVKSLENSEINQHPYVIRFISRLIQSSKIMPMERLVTPNMRL